ncbi:MAG: hypothetical protein ACYSSL_08760 [Planctomycetota bacterium]|jgi:hypothetical protein
MNQTEITKDDTIKYIEKMHRWRMAFFGLVILLAGIVIGSAFTFVFVRHAPFDNSSDSGRAAAKMLDRLAPRLQLSAEQQKSLEAILKKYMERLHEIRSDARPRISKQLQEMNDEISALLTKDQMRIWERHIKSVRKQLHPQAPHSRQRRKPYRRGKRGGPGPKSPPPQTQSAPNGN